jgi:hypothetical protein
MDGPFPGGTPPAVSGHRITRARDLPGRPGSLAHGVARTWAWLRPAGHLR